MKTKTGSIIEFCDTTDETRGELESGSENILQFEKSWGEMTVLKIKPGFGAHARSNKDGELYAHHTWVLLKE